MRARALRAEHEHALTASLGVGWLLLVTIMLKDQRLSATTASGHAIFDTRFLTRHRRRPTDARHDRPSSGLPSIVYLDDWTPCWTAVPSGTGMSGRPPSRPGVSTR